MITLIMHCFPNNEDDAAEHDVLSHGRRRLSHANRTAAAVDIKNVNLTHANNFASFSVEELTEIIFLTRSLK